MEAEDFDGWRRWECGAWDHINYGGETMGFHGLLLMVIYVGCKGYITGGFHKWGQNSIWLIMINDG